MNKEYPIPSGMAHVDMDEWRTSFRDGIDRFIQGQAEKFDIPIDTVTSASFGAIVGMAANSGATRMQIIEVVNRIFDAIDAIRSTDAPMKKEDDGTC